MLTNDSVTVAIEIPIWLTEADISALEQHYGIELAPRVGTAERTITGHIDFLQMRNGCVHILDADERNTLQINTRGDHDRRSLAVHDRLCLVWAVGKRNVAGLRITNDRSPGDFDFAVARELAPHEIRHVT